MMKETDRVGANARVPRREARDGRQEGSGMADKRLSVIRKGQMGWQTEGARQMVEQRHRRQDFSVLMFRNR